MPKRERTSARVRITRGAACLALLVPIIGTLVGAALRPASAGSADPVAQRGLAVSELHCARCHVVSERTKGFGISSTPSFKIMIIALKDWRDRFETFMARLPHPAHIRMEGDDPRPEHLPSASKEVILTLDDIEAILAYVDGMAAEIAEK